MEKQTLNKTGKINNLPTLFARNSNGSIQEWTIKINNNSFTTIEGQVGGKLTESKATVVIGKNLGRSNETSNIEQCYAEAERKWKKKQEQGYHINMSDTDNDSKYFEPMLAKKYVDEKNNIEFPVLVSAKIDGHRCILRKEGAFTRNGKRYNSIPHIEELFKPLFEKHPDYIIDGELYTHNYPFEKICSLIRKTKPTAEDLEESKKIIQYYIFDGLTSKNSELGFFTRFSLINEGIINTLPATEAIVFVDNELVYTHEDIESYHDENVRNGFEGVMIRNPSSKYENKRSKHLLKYKKFFDEEYKIIDIIEGQGNRSGMAGSLQLITKEGKIFNSGIRGSESYYKELLDTKKELINKLATIRYQEKTDTGIPRFPVAVQVGREDVE